MPRHLVMLVVVYTFEDIYFAILQNALGTGISQSKSHTNGHWPLPTVHHAGHTADIK